VGSSGPFADERALWRLALYSDRRGDTISEYRVRRDSKEYGLAIVTEESRIVAGWSGQNGPVGQEGRGRALREKETSCDYNATVEKFILFPLPIYEHLPVRHRLGGDEVARQREHPL